MPTYTMTRYRIKESPAVNPANSNEVAVLLMLRAFRGIDDDPTATLSRGWVETFNHLGTDFNAATFRFGPVLTFTLRQDSRKVAPKTVNRYLAARVAEYEARVGRRPNSLAKKELTEVVKSELLAKAPVNTELMDVVWLPAESEVWLMAQGEARRAAFETLWRETFSGSLEMLAPFSRAVEMKPETASPLRLDECSCFLERWRETAWLGRDFLLWLWHLSEERGNVLTLGGHALELQFGGKLVLATDEDKVTCAGLREDWPEAHTAILEGKWVEQGRLTIKTETMTFGLTLDADSLMPKSARLSRAFNIEDEVDRDHSRIGEFLDRIALLQELQGILDLLFRAFLEVRFGDTWEDETVPAIKNWADDCRISAAGVKNAIDAKRKHLNNRFDRMAAPPA